VAAVLPGSRSAQVGGTVTAFATVINGGTSSATDVSISPGIAFPAGFSYQTTDPVTNQPIGTPNTPVSIPSGGAQSFIIAIRPTSAFSPVNLPLNIAGSNTQPVLPITGLNTLLLSASNARTPDIVALAATVTPGLTAVVPGPTGSVAFSVAAVNVGASGTITLTADTGGAALPLGVVICQTNPSTAACLAPPATSVTTTINAGATPTFSFFVNGRGVVPFDPATNRIFARFRDANQVIRGGTSVAVTTQ
jgi:hypothetical protein